jgi:hypothetical protein
MTSPRQIPSSIVPAKVVGNMIRHPGRICTAIAKSVASKDIAKQVAIKTLVIGRLPAWRLIALPSQSISPEVLKPCRRHLGVAHRVLDVLVS